MAGKCFAGEDAPGWVQSQELAKQVYSSRIHSLGAFLLRIPTLLDHLCQVFGRLWIERQISWQ